MTELNRHFLFTKQVSLVRYFRRIGQLCFVNFYKSLLELPPGIEPGSYPYKRYASPFMLGKPVVLVRGVADGRNASG